MSDECERQLPRRDPGSGGGRARSRRSCGSLTGEVDALTAPELAALLTAQIVVAQVVVVDLDGVRFLGSAGLSVLFEANELATREDRDLRLVCKSQTASWALEATGLREHFTFAGNVPDALKNPP